MSEQVPLRDSASTEIIELIFDALKKSEFKHPGWSTDPIHASAIVAEEAGELVKASMEYHYKIGSEGAMIEEAAHTAAMGIRFLAGLFRHGYERQLTIDD